MKKRRLTEEILFWSIMTGVLILFMTIRSNAEDRQWVDGQIILNQAKQFLKDTGFETDMVVVYAPSGTFVEAGEYQWSPQLLPSSDKRKRVRLQMRRDSRVLKSWTVVFRAPSSRTCVYAARDLRAGSLVRESDIVERPEPEGTRRALCRDMYEAVGRTLRTNVKAGRPIARQTVTYRPVFKRGDRVSVTLLQQGISLELTGTALSSGYPGRELRMKTPGGRIMTVYVDMDGKPNLPENGNSL